MNRPSTSNTIQTASSAGSSEHVEQPACMNDLAKVAPAVLDILELDNYGGFQHLSWEQKVCKIFISETFETSLRVNLVSTCNND